jgi:hypothetical protein
MLPRRRLYRIAAAVELITGITLLCLPGLMIQLLFQTDVSGAERPLAQLYGLALLGLGVSCTSKPCPRSAQRGLAIYNSFASVLLFALITKAISGGPVVWAAACLHLVLGVLMIIDQRQQRSQ